MKKPTSHYVLGFVFREDLSSVVLIRKEKPAWQAGLLNGVGGKVEKSENIEWAMSREFKEECGVDIPSDSWTHYARMSGFEWCVDCFHLKNNRFHEMAATMESEKVEKIDPSRLLLYPCISNLHWLVALAMDGNDGRKHFSNIRYDKPYLWHFEDMSNQTRTLHTSV